MFLRSLFCVFTSFPKSFNLYYNHVNNRASNIRSLRFRANPGEEKRIKALDDFNVDDISEDDIDSIENEFDMIQNHISRSELDRELKRNQNLTRVKMLEKKYFKKKHEPKLLTWEEREQIRNLHKLNPEKWNIHTLAESFPATETTIQKILNSHWKPASTERIIAYNTAVAENWKKLYTGTLEISDETRAHLSRFSTRKNINLPSEDTYSTQLEKSSIAPVSTEFSAILQVDKHHVMIPDTSQNVKKQLGLTSNQTVPQDETYVIDDKISFSKHLITLNMYREKVLRSNKPLDLVDKAMIDSYKATLEMQNDVKEPVVKSSDFGVLMNKSTALEKKSEQGVIHQTIKIPSHLKGKGSLYKLNDCYYDEDGEFLYRVPGMK